MGQSFSLRKWYLDCIAADGEALIVYRAELRWKSIAIGYSSVLQFDDARGTRTRTTLRSCPEPSVHEGKLIWKAPPLGVSGTWTALASERTATLLDGPQGSVKWTCLQPRAAAEVRLPDGRTLRGLGYSELLTLTIAPWKMPIDELRWGRFLCDGHDLVWIDWSGPHRAQVVLLDGEPVSSADVGDDFVAGSSFRLSLTDNRVLRSGAIGDTALSVLPNAGKLFPGRIVGLHETKWRGRGRLTIGNQLAGEGFSIHEVVRWPS